ncbi:11351_t:CDS:1 [Gigaspora margarita]|uniref:11351_t:CDS:1 n=1 Tax=Gigaspora margarita TaxID=4874 RepID=A0ABN7XEP8_GIGMA|nr:11351_t:CDS:1 [Gigaspora margarita]
MTDIVVATAGGVAVDAKTIFQEPSIYEVLKSKKPIIAKILKARTSSGLEFLNSTAQDYHIDLEVQYNDLKNFNKTTYENIKEKVEQLSSEVNLEVIIDKLSKLIFENWNKNQPVNVKKFEKNFEIKLNDTYKNEIMYIIWSCVGWIKVKKSEEEFKLLGSPNIKILFFNLANVKQLEETEYEKVLETLQSDQLGIENF